MSSRAIDLEKLRTELRAMRRGDLLIIAERAAELVPRVKLKTLLGDYLCVDDLPEAKSRQAPLLKEVQKFYTESLGGRYFEGFAVNSRNCKEHSMGTDAFIAEFHRLVGKCIRAADAASRNGVREAFELFFRLLQRVDEADDNVVFFADEAGSWQVGVQWRTVLPAYFRCLAETASAEEFSRSVDQVIRAFAEHDRPQHLRTAGKVASAGQQAALSGMALTLAR